MSEIKCFSKKMSEILTQTQKSGGTSMNREESVKFGRFILIIIDNNRIFWKKKKIEHRECSYSILRRDILENLCVSGRIILIYNDDGKFLNKYEFPRL